MANNKLFKKLNEQMEINSVKDAPISESEKAKAEEKLIFEDSVASIIDVLDFKTR